jgi:hypothetical protein
MSALYDVVGECGRDFLVVCWKIRRRTAAKGARRLRQVLPARAVAKERAVGRAVGKNEDAASEPTHGADLPG